MDEPSRKSPRKNVAGRWKAKDTLLRSTELLERLFSSMDILIAYMDRDFNFIRVNRAYAKADGHEPEYYVGKNHFALFPNRDNEAVFRRVAETGVPCFIYDKPFVHAAHPERGVSYWDWSLQPVREADGSVGGLILSLMDRTSYVRTKEAVRESEEPYRSLVEMMPDAISVSQGGRIVFANPAAARMVGEDSPHSLMSRSAGDNLVARLCEFFKQVMTTPAAEVKFRGLEGRVVDLEAASVPTIWRGSPAPQTVAGNITERKAVEKALRASEEQLRHLSSRLLTAQEKERQVVAQDLHDGIGFNPDSLELVRDGLKGLGLTSMRERVELSGGSFTLQSAPGAGTVVQASWEQGVRP